MAALNFSRASQQVRGGRTDHATREPKTLRKWSAVWALAGAAVSVYLASYQYNLVSHVWEPVFGNGSVIVLGSDLLKPLSRMLNFPLHDAALGALGYILEAGLAVAGLRFHATSEQQLRKWLDIGYCGLVVLMGLTSLVLVFLQGAVFHAWCTLCLTSAAISEIIVLLNLHELANVAKLFRPRRWTGQRPFGQTPSG